MIPCPKCNTLFDPISKWGDKRSFCSKSCSNKGRVRTEESKAKLSMEMRKKQKQMKSSLQYDTSGPFTKVYLCVCKYSNIRFWSTTPKQVHPNLARNKKEYSYSCQFRFGIASYPNWFSTASELITKHGWYSTPGSRKGETNLNGISRDHLYSITDGWKNDIDPAIIRHPANCELIPHKENQSKHRRSKITLDELHQRIQRFEEVYGGTTRNRTSIAGLGNQNVTTTP